MKTTVRMRLSLLCVILAISALMTSCGGNKKADETSGEYTFSEIETGLLFASSIVFDTATNSVFVHGVEKRNSPQVLKTINPETLECSYFEHSALFDETRHAYAMFPSDDGCWVSVFAGEMSTVEDEPGLSVSNRLLEYYNSDWELASTSNVEDYVEKTPNPRTGFEELSYHVWGSTTEGYVVVSRAEDALIALSPEGECVQTWNLAEKAEKSNRRFYRAGTHGNDIYYFAYDLNSGTSEVNKLLPDGSIEPMYTFDEIYSNCFVGEDGRIYLASMLDLFVINENGNAELVFEWSSIAQSAGLF